ncbi:hypothetical protein CsSME_00024059 [Camellia sinensis var. sinensis]
MTNKENKLLTYQRDASHTLTTPETRHCIPEQNESESSKKHCNYFKFADEDDDGAISTIRSDAGSRTTIRTEEFNDLRRRLGEMDNEFLEHDRRLQRMEKKFKAMTCVIAFCVFMYFIM